MNLDSLIKIAQLFNFLLLPITGVAIYAVQLWLNHERRISRIETVHQIKGCDDHVT